MYVAIELNELRITHVHSSHAILDELVYLEKARLIRVQFDNTQRTGFLDGLTTEELDKLYHNTTGHHFAPALADLTRREAIAMLVESLSVRKVIMEEIVAQSKWVEYELEAPISKATQYQYALGSKSGPDILERELFPVTAPPLSSIQLAQAQQHGHSTRTRRKTPVTVHSQVKAVPRARLGHSGARPTIWAHADKVWEDEGKPMNKEKVLILRKRMMIELEALGIKKSTSSTALGGWMKERLK